MNQFNSHSKITKAMSIYLLVSHVITIGIFLTGLPALFGINGAILALLLLGPGLGAFGLYLGYALLNRKLWALTGCIWFFLLQTVSFETENWAFGLLSGFEFYVSIDVPEMTVSVNLLAVGLFIMSLLGRFQINNAPTNNAPQPTAERVG